MNALLLSLTAVATLFPYFLLALALFFLGKLLFDLSTPEIEDGKELTERDNPAFGVFLAGYLVALALALAASLQGLGPSFWINVRDIAASGVASIVLLRVSMTIGNKLVLTLPDFRGQIVEARNMGVAYSLAGLFVGSGLVIAGVMSGHSDDFVTMLRDILVYWALGQAFLVAAWLVYRLIARFDVHEVVEKGKNAAAGISLAGFFIAVGLILESSLAGASSDLGGEVLVSLGVGAAGLVVLAAARALTALVLMPKANLADEVSRQGNAAAGLVSGLSYVAVALLFGALVGSQLR